MMKRLIKGIIPLFVFILTIAFHANAQEEKNEPRIVPKSQIMEELPKEKENDLTEITLKELTKPKVTVKKNEITITENGEVITEEGWVRVDEDEYYITKDGKVLNDAFLVYGKHQVYFLEEDGTRAKGILPAEKGYMHFDYVGGELIQQKGMIRRGEKAYATNELGLPCLNAWLEMAEDSFYYFNEEGLMQKGFLPLDGTVYQTDNEGRRVTDAKPYTYMDKIYVADEKGVPYRNQWVSTDVGSYYLSEDGSAVSGEITVDGITYTCDPKEGTVITDALIWPAPTSRTISSGIGYRPNFNDYHNGIDITGSVGDDVIAAADGTVIYTGWYDTGGMTVMVEHANGMITLYMHLSKLYVQEGDKVNAAALLGAMGNTGNSTGPHLHFEIRIGSKNGMIINPQTLDYQYIQ